MGFFENLRKDFSQAVNDLLQRDAFLAGLEELSDLEDIETQKSFADIGTKSLFIQDDPRKRLENRYGTKDFREEALLVQELEQHLNLKMEKTFLEPTMQGEALARKDEKENRNKDKKKEELLKELTSKEFVLESDEKKEISGEKKQNVDDISAKDKIVTQEKVFSDTEGNDKKEANQEETILEKTQEANKEEILLEERKEMNQEEALLEESQEVEQKEVLLEESQEIEQKEVFLEQPQEVEQKEVVLEKTQNKKEVIKPEKRSQKATEVPNLTKHTKRVNEETNFEKRSKKTTEVSNSRNHTQKASGLEKLEEHFKKNIEIQKNAEMVKAKQSIQKTISKPIEAENRVSTNGNKNRKMKQRNQRNMTKDKERELAVFETLTTEEMDTFDKLLADNKLLANDKKEKLEDEKMARFDTRGTNNMSTSNLDMDYIAEELNEEEDEVSDVMEHDVTIIAKGTKVVGSISCETSLEIDGTVMGDIECLGRLAVRGYVSGNSSAAEIYVSATRLDGNLSSEGSVKVESGTIVVGDIEATSAVVAGAVKGEIDINGPITIDSTAIIKGNIKAKSIQINNGAVVDGHYTLSYSAVDIESYFGKGSSGETKQQIFMEQQQPIKNEQKKEKNNKQ